MAGSPDPKVALDSPAAAAFVRTEDASASISDAAPEVPVTVTQRLGRFILLRKLGEGGMGTVFAAYDEQLDRRVAVKLLRRLDQEQSAHRVRVLREAQAMARVSHENVLHVYEVGELNGQIFIAMEFVDGLTLAAWQRQRDRSFREVLHIYRQAALGLLAAHRAGLVHRDFKPDNVLLDGSEADCRARVADFGLARLQASTESREPVVPSSPASALYSQTTQAGVIAGTPGYMSPEQYLGEDVDARSDQFSFCVALYEALYRTAPWQSNEAAAVAADTVVGRLRPPPPHTAVPATIFAALARGLSAAPAARFPSMAELLEALDPDSQRESAAAAKARRWTTVLGILFSALISGISVERSLSHPLSLRELTGLTVFLTCFVAVVALVARRTLLSTPIHRGLMLRTLILFITSLCIRCVGLRLHLDAATLLPFDFIAVGGVTATMAQQYMPAMWWAAAGYAAAALATLLWPRYAVLLAVVAYMLYAIIWYYGWARIAGRQGQQKQGAGPTRVAS